MKKIRRGVFETNSSSSHSISIADSDNKAKLDTLSVEDEKEGKVCRIYQDKFGWEMETFNSPTMKASYCFTYAKGDINLLERLGRVIKEHLGDDVTVEFVDGEGYIDHQSLDIAEEAFESDDTLKRFIFNPHSYFETGNDNC